MCASFCWQQGLQTVIGISLQAKEKAFGLLLLGTPENRVFHRRLN